MRTFPFLTLLVVLAAATVCQAQSAPTMNPIQRVTGVEPSSQIEYALLSTPGTLTGAPDPVAAPPRLTAQCTRNAGGKFKFELLADFGDVPELSFFPPWRPSPGDLYPPALRKQQLTMEFLGYTRVKPVKRQWEYLQQPAGELRYATPGMASANMESISFYLQYLRALPTLRLSAAGKGTLEFETAAWQTAIKAEPLCNASGL